jgi:DNA-binding XRE family transcriptional regulator
MATMNKDRKYYALYQHLRQNSGNEILLTFAEIEHLLHNEFPATARAQRAWWSNRRNGAAQADAWMEAGYHVVDVDFVGERVTFRKPTLVYNIQRKGGIVIWDSDLIKHLRHHMGLSQTELAEELGVRQQTISEWETGMYQPKRAMSKLLSFVAERAGFTYGEETSEKSK